jgi:hypothetical protein
MHLLTDCPSPPADVEAAAAGMRYSLVPADDGPAAPAPVPAPAPAPAPAPVPAPAVDDDGDVDMGDADADGGVVIPPGTTGNAFAALGSEGSEDTADAPAAAAPPASGGGGGGGGGSAAAAPADASARFWGPDGFTCPSCGYCVGFGGTYESLVDHMVAACAHSEANMAILFSS